MQGTNDNDNVGSIFEAKWRNNSNVFREQMPRNNSNVFREQMPRIKNAYLCLRCLEADSASKITI